MPERLPPSVRKTIIEGTLSGMKRKEIVSLVRRSHGKIGSGSVTNLESEFIDDVETKGLEAAARDWSVSELVSGLQEVGSFAKRNSIGLEEMADGGKLAIALREDKIPVGDVSNYIVPVYTRLKKEGYDVDNVVSHVVELDGLLEKHHMTFDELRAEYETTARKLADATKELASLNEQTNNRKKAIGGLEREYGVSLAAAKAYVATRQSLESMGLDIDDLSSTERCLEALKERKFNPMKVITAFSKIEDLAEKTASLKSELASLNEDIGRQHSELKRVLTELATRKDDLQEAKMLMSAGLSIEAIQQVRETVEFAGKRRRIAPSKAMQLFLKDIERNYDTILGLRQTLRELDGVKQTVEEELRKARADKTSLEKYCTARQKQIDAYERLAEKGVDDKTLLTWDVVISESGLDKVTVTTELKKLGTLEHSRERLQQEISKEEDLKKTLASEVRELESSKAALIASIKTVTDEGIGALDLHLDKFKSSVDKIEKQTLNSVATKSGEVKDRVKELENSVTETVSRVQGGLSAMNEKVDELLGKAIRTGRELQELNKAKLLLDFYDNATGTRTDVYNMSLKFAGNLERWAEANNLYTIKSSAATLEMTIRNESGFGKVQPS